MSTVHRFRKSFVALAPLARLRTLFLGLALLNIAVMVPSVLATDRPLFERLAAVAALLALGGYWFANHRRSRFPLALELPEAAAILLILYVAPGNPFLPLSGLMFRSLYGSSPVSMLRYALWAAALLLAHATRGSVQLHGDVGRALGLAAVPIVLPALRGALERLEASERRLASLVQNSSDVVTVVDPDLTVRWQAASIRAVLGHEHRALLGSNLLALVHPDDRDVLRDFVAAATSDE